MNPIATKWLAELWKPMSKPMRSKLRAMRESTRKAATLRNGKIGTVMERSAYDHLMAISVWVNGVLDADHAVRKAVRKVKRAKIQVITRCREGQ